MTSSRPAPAAAFTALCAGVLLAGCAGGLTSGTPPEQAYVLRVAAAGPDAAAAAALPVSLRVERPLPAPGLESDRIMVVHADRRLDAYTASRWAGPLPDVVAALAIEALRGSGRFAVVQDERAPFAADYLLRVGLRHFEAQYPGTGAGPVVRVTLDCSVGRRSDRGVVASFTADASTSASADRLGAVVEAFEASVHTALAAVLDGTSGAIAADREAALRTSTAPSPR